MAREEAGKERTGGRVSRGHVDMAGPMPIVLACEREHVYFVVDDYSRVVYTRALRLKSAVEVQNDSREQV